jgi:hypothetical protein
MAGFRRLIPSKLLSFICLRQFSLNDDAFFFKDVDLFFGVAQLDQHFFGMMAERWRGTPNNFRTSRKKRNKRTQVTI